MTVLRDLLLKIILACAACWLASCTSLTTIPADRSIGPAEETASAVERLVDRGRFDSAREVIAKARPATEPSSTDRALLNFTRAWIDREEAMTVEDGDRVHLLKNAAEAYKAVLANDPSHRSAIRGLAAVLMPLQEYELGITYFHDLINSGRQNDGATGVAWLAIGDLRRLRNRDADVEGAVNAYARAVRHGNEDAASRIVSLPGIGMDALERHCEDLARTGDVIAAATGFEYLMARALRNGDEASRFCVRWLGTAGIGGHFDEAQADRLPASLGDFPCEAIDALNSILKDLEAGKLDCSDKERAEYAAQIRFWQEQPDRRQALAVGLRSLARSIEREVQPTPTSCEALKRAAAAFELALEVAPDGIVRNPLLDAEHPDVRLSVAIDLAVFYHGHRRLENAGHRVRRLLERGGPLDQSEFRRVGRTDAERTEYFGLVGLVFTDAVDNPRWMTDPADRNDLERVRELARRYLRPAIEASPGPTPYLNHKYAEVLDTLGRHEESVLAHHAGARDYFAIREPSQAMRVGEAGLRVGYRARDDIGFRTRALEEYLYSRRGLYLGVSVGLTDGHESGSELAGNINDRQTGRNVSASLDDTDDGAKLFLGYQFDSPFAVELGYVDLGGYVSSIDTVSIDPMLLSDAIDIHPITGRGISISVLGTPIEYGRFSAFGKVGAWYWESDLDITIGNQSVQSEFDGIDFQAGVGMQYRFSRSLRLRAEYERYFLDDDYVDMLSLGLVYKF